MPSQRRTLPETTPTTTTRPRPARRKGMKLCAACGTFVSAGSLVAGECPPCAGLIALPLRDARGRFLTGAPSTGSPAGSWSR